MAKIEVIDFLKDVELNRRKLIQNCIENGTNVSKNASLSDVVYANNNIIRDDSKCEVRFFDGDGNNISTKYVEKNSNVIPPANPNLDDEYLSFEGWFSATGDNNFDNIIADLDFGALYKIKEKDLCYIMFINLTEQTGLDVSFTLNAYGMSSKATIVWGDNSENTVENSPASGKYEPTISHTYPHFGSYIIKIYVENRLEEQSDYTHQFVLRSMTNSLMLTKLYCDVCTSSITQTAYNLKVLVITNTIINITQVASPRPCVIPYYICKKAIPNGFGTEGYSSSSYTERNLPLKLIIVQNEAIMYGVIIDKYVGKFSTLKHCTIFNLIDYNNFETQTGTISYSNINKYNYAYNPLYVPGFNFTSLPKNFNLPYGLRNVPNFNNSFINELYIPSTVVTLNSNTSLNLSSLENLWLYPNFNLNLNLSKAGSLSNETLLSFSNNLADLNSSDPKTLTLNSKTKNKCDVINIRLNHGIYEFCKPEDIGATTISQVLQNKNWTISVGT